MAVNPVMALECASLVKVGLVLFVAVHVLPLGSGCHIGLYERMINEYCLPTFTKDMGTLDQGLWCSWPDTLKPYEELTNCTYVVALGMDCFWPNHIIDHFFMDLHRLYFHRCALTGRLLHDPPISILGPFIAVPVLVTLLVTALVVWRSKRTEGVL